jgi:hypothetical protein
LFFERDFRFKALPGIAKMATARNLVKQETRPKNPAISEPFTNISFFETTNRSEKDISFIKTT